MIGAIGERKPAAAGPPRWNGWALTRKGRLDDGVLRTDIARFGWTKPRSAPGCRWPAPWRVPRKATRAGLGAEVLRSELNKRRWELMMAVGGADALEWEGARSNDSAAARTWLQHQGQQHHEGGTSEVQ